LFYPSKLETQKKTVRRAPKCAFQTLCSTDCGRRDKENLIRVTTVDSFVRVRQNFELVKGR